MNLHMSDWAFDYVRHVLEEKGWTAADLARLAGVSHSTINRPLKTPGWKSSLSRTTLAKIAEVSGIDPTPFAPPGETIAPPPATPANVAMIPVYDVAASAGNGAVVEYEPIAEQLAFPRDYLKKLTRSDPRNLSIISVKGDSMEPTLKDDDIVLLDASKTSLNFDGLFVLRFGDALHVKRVTRAAKHGFITILSDNSSYPPQEHPAEEVAVIGKVLWYGRKV